MPRRDHTSVSDPFEGLHQEALRVFDVDNGADGNTPVKLEHFRCIGSYSWVDAPEPTILVPGSPREWLDPELPLDVGYDVGLQMFDPTGYHMRNSSTLIPLFRAVDAVQAGAGARANSSSADKTGMDWGAVDLVLDRSSMRKLLRWVWYTHSNADQGTRHEGHSEGTTAGTNSNVHSKRRKPPPDFRLDFQLGGEKTVLVERWDTRTFQRKLPPAHGCRNNFDNLATSPAPRGYQSTKFHHRIVQYDLEGLNLVVRFEVDACIPSSDDPADMLARLTLSSSLSSPHAMRVAPSVDSDTAITVVRGGALTPHASLIEITTRSATARPAHTWYETYIQLFLSQTPNFYFAKHERGLFTEVEKHPLASPKFARYQRDERIQRCLRQLVLILTTIQRAVQEQGKSGRLSVVCHQGTLALFERIDYGGGGRAGRLPDSELSRFEIRAK
ncbi:hypothetical protein BD414DRAFT_416626 [Trametes punicea]|nr:hypothetical protein BD414DRAFT_416626 [Trametes punicea]